MLTRKELQFKRLYAENALQVAKLAEEDQKYKSFDIVVKALMEYIELLKRIERSKKDTNVDFARNVTKKLK